MKDLKKPIARPISSLAERRRQDQNKILQTMKPLELRLEELEQDQLRLIDLALDQETQILDLKQQIDKLEDRMLSLIGMLTSAN